MGRPRAVRALWILVLAVARGAAEKCAYSDPGCVVIVCCGDSLTAGSGARDGGDWPALLQTALGDRFNVINKGLSGRTVMFHDEDAWLDSDEGREALELANTDLFIVGLGTNDAKDTWWPANETETFSDAYADLVGKLVAAATTEPAILVSIPPPQLHAWKNWVDVSYINDALPALIPGIGARVGARAVVDLHEAFGASDPNDDLYDDPIHPNDAGYVVIAAAMADAVRDIFRHPSPAPTASAAPTNSPMPTTSAPSLAPSYAPSTYAPSTYGPTSATPSSAPTSAHPTATRAPSAHPTTAVPSTAAPTTAAPTYEPTYAPTSSAPSYAGPEKGDFTVPSTRVCSDHTFQKNHPYVVRTRRKMITRPKMS